jgi:hypothetical protein
MRPVLGVAALVAPLMLCVACASKPSSDATPPQNPNIITYEQLEQHRFTDLYDAIEACIPTG